ncbi:CDP-archaeol synthase [Thiohalophilus sp.]|uniref:CDP-archaeol synthase n=1 Tax=Thiohalophilus sp. TaxID=3028392 RepID=UPI0039754C6F
MAGQQHTLYHYDMTILFCLFLLLVANGAPILARLLPGVRHWNRPLDGGYRLSDGEPLFGAHKTWRGVVAAIILTGAAAGLAGYPLWLGALFGGLSMLGDLLASFIKRRLRWRSGAPAPILDQLPEALLPLLFLAGPLELGGLSIPLIAVLFTVLDGILSRLLYHWRVRRHPW